MSLSSEQRRRAKEKLARDRGITAESISDESVALAIAAGNILLSDIGGVASSSDSSYDTGAGSSGGGTSPRRHHGGAAEPTIAERARAMGIKPHRDADEEIALLTGQPLAFPAEAAEPAPERTVKDDGSCD